MAVDFALHNHELGIAQRTSGGTPSALKLAFGPISPA